MLLTMIVARVIQVMAVKICEQKLGKTDPIRMNQTTRSKTSDERTSTLYYQVAMQETDPNLCARLTKGRLTLVARRVARFAMIGI